MSQRLLNIGRVGATGQQKGGVGVPEIVSSYVGQLRSLEQGLEEPVDYVLCVEGEYPCPWQIRVLSPRNLSLLASDQEGCRVGFNAM